MKVVGGIYAIVGLVALIDLATTWGVISSLLISGMAVFTTAAWVTYASADAVSDLGEYKNLDICLEGKGY